MFLWARGSEERKGEMIPPVIWVPRKQEMIEEFSLPEGRNFAPRVQKSAAPVPGFCVCLLLLSKGWVNAGIKATNTISKTNSKS